MNFGTFRIERILLVLLVLSISMIVGWYGEKAVEKFMANNSVSNKAAVF